MGTLYENAPKRGMGIEIETSESTMRKNQYLLWIYRNKEPIAHIWIENHVGDYLIKQLQQRKK